MNFGSWASFNILVLLNAYSKLYKAATYNLFENGFIEQIFITLYFLCFVSSLDFTTIIDISRLDFKSNVIFLVSQH